MVRNIVGQCGVIGYLILAASVLLFGFIFGAAADYFSRKDRDGFLERCGRYKDLIEPLATISVSLGLLGTARGFIKVFAAFKLKFDPAILTAGMSEAYLSTIVGLACGIISVAACYALDTARLLKSGACEKHDQKS